MSPLDVIQLNLFFFFFYIQSVSICLLTGLFNPFTFYDLIDVGRLTSASILFFSSVSHLFMFFGSSFTDLFCIKWIFSNGAF